MKIICCHEAYVTLWDEGKIIHLDAENRPSTECDDQDAKRRLQPIVSFEGFVQARQKRGKTAIEVRDDFMKRGYDIHAAASLVTFYWSENIAREMAKACSNPECPDAGKCNGACAKNF